MYQSWPERFCLCSVPAGMFLFHNLLLLLSVELLLSMSDISVISFFVVMHFIHYFLHMLSVLSLE